MLSLYRRFSAPIFWTSVAIVYVVAILPSARAPDLGAGDKVNHIAAFLTLTLLGRAAYPGRPAWRLAIGLSTFGALIELTQAIPFLRRDPSVWDWVADSTAILIALATAIAFQRRFPARATA